MGRDAQENEFLARRVWRFLAWLGAVGLHGEAHLTQRGMKP